MQNSQQADSECAYAWLPYSVLKQFPNTLCSQSKGSSKTDVTVVEGEVERDDVGRGSKSLKLRDVILKTTLNYPKGLFCPCIP